MNRAERRKALKSINTPKKFTDTLSEALDFQRRDRKRGCLLKEIAKKYNLSISQCSCICRNKFWNIYDNPELLGGE